MLRHGAEDFLHALSTFSNAFWGVSKGFILVNEAGMVFFYAIFRNLTKSLSKGGR
ncbi:hypothetical protein PPSQR21_021600 [Paenibacillus polymyxa SQR-21]|jgi:hypothetical protein|nr:hypothetical protein PPSQR21_021600 [Paenibacillus polymyxa SQR-21]